jgi:hypothetical protein
VGPVPSQQPEQGGEDAMSVFPEKDAAGERDKQARDKKSAIKGEQ